MPTRSTISVKCRTLGEAYYRTSVGPMLFNLAASPRDSPFPAVVNQANAEIYGQHRYQLAVKMTSEQIAEAQRLARDWKPK